MLSANADNIVDFVIFSPKEMSKVKANELFQKEIRRRTVRDWKVNDDGATSGVTEDGILVLVNAGSEITSEILLKREFYRLRQSKGRYSRLSLSDFSPSAQKALKSKVQEKFPGYEFAENSRLLIEVQVERSVRFKQGFYSNNTSETESTEKYSGLGKDGFTPGALTLEQVDLLKGHELRKINPYRPELPTILEFDRLFVSPNASKVRQLSILSKASETLKFKLAKELDELDQVMKNSLLSPKRREEFDRLKQCQNLSDAIKVSPVLSDAILDFVQPNFRLFGFATESELRAQMEYAKVGTTIRFAVVVQVPGKNQTDLINF